MIDTGATNGVTTAAAGAGNGVDAADGEGATRGVSAPATCADAITPAKSKLQARERRFIPALRKRRPASSAAQAAAGEK
jgi:hypothetical protein